MICGLCHADVPAWLWADNEPGGHHVILDTPVTIRSLPPDPDGPNDVIKIMAEQKIKVTLCREVHAPLSGLDRMREAVEAARNPRPPSHPVTLCGELKPGDTYYLAGDLTNTPRVYAGNGPRGRHAAKWSAVPWWKRMLEKLFA